MLSQIAKALDGDLRELFISTKDTRKTNIEILDNIRKEVDELTDQLKEPWKIKHNNK